MKTFFDQAKKEEGSVLVVALLILVLLTLIGISATRTGEIELQISGNEKYHKIAFYAAESGWEVAVSWLDDQYPPSTTSSVAGPTTMPGDNNTTYSYSTSFDGAEHAPGYSTEFKRYIYQIDSTGALGNAESQVSVTAGKIVYIGGY